jgi:ATP-dependent Clp protease ATP-binding subunit ClpA
MFNRFTRAARAVAEQAQDEADALGHDHIGTEHLLLAVAARGGLPASLGLEHAALQAAVRDAAIGNQVARGAGTRSSALATKWTAAASRSVNERMWSQHATGPSGSSNSPCSSSGATPAASR